MIRNEDGSRQWALIIGIVVALAISPALREPPPLKTTLMQGLNVLWTDPGNAASLDFQYGIGGTGRQPQPPFRFLNEDFSGSNPKVNVIDGRGTKWNVKWGQEASASTFCTRLLWACGYFAEIEYFLPQGRIDGAHDLKRAHSFIAKDGSFANARFQLRSDAPKYLKGAHWTWTKNPFVGTPQLKGLKILLLLVSNWDTKEANLTVFEDDSTGDRRFFYADDDWGASLGKWGNIITWTKWDCDGFAEQTPHFVRRLSDGSLQWGFKGKNRKDVTSDITVQDVRWLLQYLGQVTDAQIRTGLAASGATPENVDCFASALRQRIEQLKRVSAEVPQ
jgi:hypothetical protein